MSEIEISEYKGEGYKPLVSFGSWRVAVANYKQTLEEENFKSMERHLLTDEVFVLIYGEAILYVGEKKERYLLEKGKVYNVKKGMWHHICMKPNTSVMIVENDNTSSENSEYIDF